MSCCSYKNVGGVIPVVKEAADVIPVVKEYADVTPVVKEYADVHILDVKECVDVIILGTVYGPILGVKEAAGVILVLKEESFTVGVG